MSDSISLLIPQDQVPALKSFFTQRVIEGGAMIQEGNKLIAEARAMLALLDKQETGTVNGSKAVIPAVATSTAPDGYNAQWTWGRKIDFILNISENTTTGVIEKILEYEPNRRPDRQTVVRSVSAMLSAGTTENGKYKRYKNDRNENVYSLNN